MKETTRIFIVGGGAIGFSLAAHLKAAGRDVTVLRVSGNSPEEATQTIAVRSGEGEILEQEVVSRPLSSQGEIDGLVVLATKANVNDYLAEVLSRSAHSTDLLVMQNGIGVERPFLGKGFRSLSRCVVYITAEKVGDDSYTARMVKPSPIGSVGAADDRSAEIAGRLSTETLAFYRENDIDREIWKKGIINTVFNSVCPLLDVDNGVFDRDDMAMGLAREIVMECVPVASRLGVAVSAEEILDQIVMISRRSKGQLISTLQDIRANRDTEIAYFNLEICRVGGETEPPIDLPLTRMLGLLTLKKAEIAKERAKIGGATQ